MKTAIVTLFCVIAQLCTAQITFEKWIGGTNSDEAKGVIQLPDSGYAVLARSWSWGQGGSDLLLIRLDKFGDTLWTKLYGGTSNEFTNGALRSTPDKGFIIAGNTYSYGTGTPSGFNWYLIKTDSAGNVNWTRTWGSTGNDELKHVLPTSDGNYLLSGAWRVSGQTKGILLKVDATGNTIWGDTLFSTATSHFMWACEKTPDEYVVAGYNFMGSTSDAVLIKYNAEGNMLINKRFDYGEAETAVTIEPVSSGGYICSAIHGTLPYDPWILRLDDNLDTLFTKVMDFDYNIAGFSAKEYSIYPQDNGFIICGSDSNKLMLRKTDASLNTIWQRLYGGTMGEMGYEGIPTNDMGFIAVGLTNSYGSGSNDCYIIKTDSLGMQANSIGISNTESEKFIASPNPFTDHIRIEGNLTGNKKALTITDIQGRIVFNTVLVNATEILDLSDLPNNIYILTLSDNTGVKRCKLVKNKD